MKVCIRCQIPKSLDAFGNYARYPDGKHRYCRDCWNTLVNTHRHAHGVPPRLPFLERLWSAIQQCGHEDACVYCCWPWLKSTDQDGYGKFTLTFDSKHLTLPATRVVYEIWHARPIPPGKLVCHYCDTPACCNPLHLWLGTLQSNRQDAMNKGRQARGTAAGVHTKPEAFPRGEQHPKAKLTVQQVLDIRECYAEGFITMHDLGEYYGVSDFAIKCIIHRKTWRHI
jgi:HNH endonuclease